MSAFRRYPFCRGGSKTLKNGKYGYSIKISICETPVIGYIRKQVSMGYGYMRNRYGWTYLVYRELS